MMERPMPQGGASTGRTPQCVWHMARSARPLMAQHVQQHCICLLSLNRPSTGPPETAEKRPGLLNCACMHTCTKSPGAATVCSAVAAARHACDLQPLRPDCSPRTGCRAGGRPRSAGDLQSQHARLCFSSSRLLQVIRASHYLDCNCDAHSADLGSATSVGAILAPATFSPPINSIVPRR